MHTEASVKCPEGQLLQPASRSSSCSRRSVPLDFDTITVGSGSSGMPTSCWAWEPGIGRLEVASDADGPFPNPGGDLPPPHPATGCSSGDGFVHVGRAVPRRAGHGPSPQISPSSQDRGG